MSALKKQLEKMLPRFREEANRISDPEIKRRFYLIKAVVESPKDVKKVCESRGVSTDFFYKWGDRLRRHRKLSSLKPRSRRPKKSPMRTSGRIEKKITAMKKAYPYWGQERISFYLARLFGIICSPSTVYAVMRRFKIVSQKYREQRTKRHLKRYRRPIPGYLQLDIKYVPYLIDGKQYYEFNCVDHCSSWRLIRQYRTKSIFAFKYYLKELEENCPFPIVEIQTDNDGIFTDKYRIGGDGKSTGQHMFDVWCEVRKIRHKLIPVGEKELNGKVENTHKFDDEEFYSQNNFKNFEKLELMTRDYNRRWNQERHTKTLGWKTPHEVIELSAILWTAWLINLRQKYHPNATSIVKINDDGLIIPVPTRTNITVKKPTNRTSKLTAVDRYLQYMAWEEKKKLRSFLTVPAMCQIFSPIFVKTFYFVLIPIIYEATYK